MDNETILLDLKVNDDTIRVNLELETGQANKELEEIVCSMAGLTKIIDQMSAAITKAFAPAIKFCKRFRR